MRMTAKTITLLNSIYSEGLEEVIALDSMCLCERELDERFEKVLEVLWNHQEYEAMKTLTEMIMNANKQIFFS